MKTQFDERRHLLARSARVNGTWALSVTKNVVTFFKVRSAERMILCPREDRIVASKYSLKRLKRVLDRNVEAGVMISINHGANRKDYVKMRDCDYSPPGATTDLLRRII